MSVTGDFGDNSSGGGFPDSFAGNQGTMLTQTLKSDNFTEGVSGWEITRDGNAEFNNGTFRGEVVVESGNEAITIEVVGGTQPTMTFITGDVLESVPANIVVEVAGAGVTRSIIWLFSGPKMAAPGNDWVQIELVSGDANGGTLAGGFLNYITKAGAVEAVLSWGNNVVNIPGSLTAGLVNGLALATFATLGAASNAGAPAGAPPTGTATQASSFAAGSPALSYFTAFEGTYNQTVAAVNNNASLLNQVIAILNAWN